MKYLKYKDKKKRDVYIVSSKSDDKNYTDKIKEKHGKRDKIKEKHEKRDKNKRNH